MTSLYGLILPGLTFLGTFFSFWSGYLGLGIGGIGDFAVNAFLSAILGDVVYVVSENQTLQAKQIFRISLSALIGALVGGWLGTLLGFPALISSISAAAVVGWQENYPSFNS